MSTDLIKETLEQRAKTHGDFRQVAAVAQNLKDILAHGLSAKELNLSAVQAEAIEVICSKLARIVCGNPDEPDHWLDIQGYAELVLRTLVVDS